METFKEIITLRSVYGKTAQTFYIVPCPNPETGMYPEHVRMLDTHTGQMILSEQDKEDLRNGAIFIPQDVPIAVKNNTTFDMSVPYEKAQWEAIKYSPLIAMDRQQKDRDGNFVIDGASPVYKVNTQNGTEIEVAQGRYGLADLYVEKVGMESRIRNERARLVTHAKSLIFEHEDREDMLRILRLMEKDMSHAHTYDIQDYLLQLAEREPNKVIELYTGATSDIRLLIITALERFVITKREGVYYYGEHKIGASLDGAVATLQNPKNAKLREWIEQETFPEMYAKEKAPEATEAKPAAAARKK